MKPGGVPQQRYAAGDTDKTSVLLIGNNKLYVFVRLYIMIYNRLRRAKELCRRASSQKRPIVRHWKDRVASPRSRAIAAASGSNASDSMVPIGSGTQNAASSVASPTAASPSLSNSVVSPSSVPATDEDVALKSQIRSGKTYQEFLGHVHDLIAGKIENSAFEDICRTLMGASTASYMMFTLDKLLLALMKQASIICEESESESTTKRKCSSKRKRMMQLWKPISSSRRKGSKKKAKTSKASKAKKSTKNNSRYKSLALKVPYDKSNLPDNLFRVQFVPGQVRKTPAKAGSHGPGVWDETMVREIQPQVCIELIGETSKLRNEVTLDPSVVGAQVYADRYLMESGSTGRRACLGPRFQIIGARCKC